MCTVIHIYNFIYNIACHLKHKNHEGEETTTTDLKFYSVLFPDKKK